MARLRKSLHFWLWAPILYPVLWRETAPVYFRVAVLYTNMFVLAASTRRNSSVFRYISLTGTGTMRGLLSRNNLSGFLP